MSVNKNAAGAIVPVRERREAVGSLAATNAEIVLDVNGDESALVHVQSTAFIGTLEFTGSANADGTDYMPVAAYPYSIGCVGGTIPLAGQPLLIHALVAANTRVVYAVPVGQLKKLRVRASAYTSGACECTIISEAQASLNTAINAKPGTLIATQTAAVGAAATATVASVAGLRHIIDFIHITRSATAALTASATPVVITTSNLPGALAMTMGSDAGGIGVDKELRVDFGGTGLAATALGTNTTVVCPAYVGVIWRINIGYRLGL